MVAPDPARLFFVCAYMPVLTYTWALCRAYLHHLLDTNELLGWMLLEVHNVHHMQRFMADVRAAVEGGTLGALEASLPQRDALPPPAAATPSTAARHAPASAPANDTSPGERGR